MIDTGFGYKNLHRLTYDVSQARGSLTLLADTILGFWKFASFEFNGIRDLENFWIGILFLKNGMSYDYITERKKFMSFHRQGSVFKVKTVDGKYAGTLSGKELDDLEKMIKCLLVESGANIVEIELKVRPPKK